MALVFRTSSIANAGPTTIKNSALSYEEGDGNFAYLLTNMSGSNINISGDTLLTGQLQIDGTIFLPQITSASQNNILTYNTSSGRIYYTSSNNFAAASDLNSYVTTASFTAFTSSYNTGSFSGSFIGELIGTSSWAVSASWAPSTATPTGSLLATASVSNNTITFTKGDASQFSITVATGSGGSGGSIATGSFITTGSATSAQGISGSLSLTGSLLLTGSAVVKAPYNNDTMNHKLSLGTLSINMNSLSGSVGNRLLPGGYDAYYVFFNESFNNDTKIKLWDTTNLSFSAINPQWLGPITIISDANSGNNGWIVPGDILTTIEGQPSQSIALGEFIRICCDYSSGLCDWKIIERGRTNERTLTTSNTGSFITTGSATAVQRISGSLQISSSLGVTGSIVATNIYGTRVGGTMIGNSVGPNYLDLSQIDAESNGTYLMTPYLHEYFFNGGSNSISGKSYSSNDAALGYYYLNPSTFEYNLPAIYFTKTSFNGPGIKYATVISDNSTTSIENFIDLNGGLANAKYKHNSRTHVLTVTGSFLARDGVSLGTNISNTHFITGSVRTTGSLFLSGLTSASQTNILTYNSSTGQVYFTASSAIGSGGSATPGGSDTQIQFNSGSTFSGNAAFRFIYTSESLEQGNSATAIGPYSHAEGDATQAIGEASHAEGLQTIALGLYSHAEGESTIAVGRASHAGGYSTIASSSYQTVVGIHNATSSIESAFIVGNGSPEGGENGRRNLLFAGGTSVIVTGSFSVSGSATLPDILTLPYQHPLPNLLPTGSIALSGSGATFVGMFVFTGAWTQI